jgi:Cu2+-exporting ATPase
LSDTCFHCSLPVENPGEFTAVIDDKTEQFCCFACQTVCQTIYQSGLGSFYLKTPKGESLTPPAEVTNDLKSFDSDDVQADYVDQLTENRTIHLLVEGIHCAACIWLIEQTLNKQNAVLSVEANLTSKRLRLQWNNSQAKLSELLTLLAGIGYAAVPFDPETAEGALAKRHRGMLYRMAFSGFAMMNLMWVSIALYSGANEGEFRNWFHWIGFVIATPTLLYSGFPFYKNAITGLKNGYLTMDLPIAIGASITFMYSTYITVSESTTGEVYFDTVVNFLFVVLVGRYLESISKREALSSTTRLLELQPKLATLVSGMDTKVVPVRAVNIGDVVLIKPGEQVPVDGLVVEGKSGVDESMLTGESLPVLKTLNDQVVAGSINGEGVLKVQAQHVLRNTALAKIVELMERAQSSKAPIQALADRIVPWFVVITLTLATLTFVYWFQTDFEIALLAATSVMIITCPCAFGMATPMSIAVSTGVGANLGILVKQGLALETLSKVTHFVFDKTGTLTNGHLELKQVLSAPTFSQSEVVKLAASVEQHSEHLLAKAIVEHAKHQKVSLEPLTGFKAYPGEGVQAFRKGQQIQVGTAAWMRQNNVSDVAGLFGSALGMEEKGQTCVFLAIDKKVIGLLALADSLREDTLKVIRLLKQQGIKITILSGDKAAVVNSVTAEFGDVARRAEVLPKDKSDVVKQLQEKGEIVAMVGDGINDSPALIQSDVSIAMASGTDVSIESADIVLSHQSFENVIKARNLALATLRTIKQNIMLSFTYNLIMVPLAMMALVNPLVAALTMPISSLVVIGNAARLRRFLRD